VAVRLLDEAVDHRKAEPGALAVDLGGEEGLEDTAADLVAHALAGVGHREHHVLARRHLARRAGVGFVERRVGDLHGQAAAARHGVAGV